MIVVDLLADAFFAAVAGCGFGIISSPPRRALPRIALLAAFGHAARYSLMNYGGIDIATSSFFAALAVGLLSLWLARGAHCPMTVLYIPALLPMIPGIYAYKTVFSLIMFLHTMNHPVEGVEFMNAFFLNGTVTFSVIALLTFGATLPNLLFKKLAFSMTRKRQMHK